MSAALVTQREWASQLGVSVDTFQNWRKAGRIPMPIPHLSGWPRWSRETVERVTSEIVNGGQGRYFRTATRRRNRGFQSQASRFVQPVGPSKGSRLSPQDVGVRHGDIVRDDESVDQCHSVVGAR